MARISAPPSRDPDTEPFGISERKRAALLLALLAITAVLLVGIMMYTLGSSDGSSDHPTLAGPDGPAVTVTGEAQPPAVQRPTTKPSPTGTTRARSVSCPTSAPCALPDDVGNAAKALNAYRVAHGLPPVTASVTRTAQNCAMNEGDGSACPSGYFWEPVGRSGAEVVDKIAASSDGGVGWLLDPRMTAVQIGWVYLPSSKSYECVLVSNG